MRTRDWHDPDAASWVLSESVQLLSGTLGYALVLSRTLSQAVQVNDRQRSLVSPCVLLPIHHVCIVRGPPLVSC